MAELLPRVSATGVPDRGGEVGRRAWRVSCSAKRGAELAEIESRSAITTKVPPERGGSGVMPVPPRQGADDARVTVPELPGDLEVDAITLGSQPSSISLETPTPAVRPPSRPGPNHSGGNVRRRGADPRGAGGRLGSTGGTRARGVELRRGHDEPRHGGLRTAAAGVRERIDGGLVAGFVAIRGRPRSTAFSASATSDARHAGRDSQDEGQLQSALRAQFRGGPRVQARVFLKDEIHGVRHEDRFVPRHPDVRGARQRPCPRRRNTPVGGGGGGRTGGHGPLRGCRGKGPEAARVPQAWSRRAKSCACARAPSAPRWCRATAPDGWPRSTGRCRRSYSAKDSAGGDAIDVKVSVDGRPLADKLDGLAVKPLDPGMRTFRFERADGSAATAQVLVKEGDKAQSVAVVLAVPNALVGSSGRWRWWAAGRDSSRHARPGEIDVRERHAVGRAPDGWRRSRRLGRRRRGRVRRQGQGTTGPRVSWDPSARPTRGTL